MEADRQVDSQTYVQAESDLLADGCIVPRSRTNKARSPILGIVN